MKICTLHVQLNFFLHRVMDEEYLHWQIYSFHLSNVELMLVEKQQVMDEFQDSKKYKNINYSYIFLFLKPLFFVRQYPKREHKLFEVSIINNNNTTYKRIDKNFTFPKPISSARTHDKLYRLRNINQLIPSLKNRFQRWFFYF